MFNMTAFLSYCVAILFTPGPNIIMSTAHSSQYGLKRTMNFIFGISTGVFIITLACSFFNLLLINILPKLQIAMGIFGSIYMLYLAIKIIKSKPIEDSDSKGSLNYPSGIILQFANPKFLIFALTVTSNFIVPYFHSLQMLVFFSLIVGLLGFVSNLIWAIFGSVFKMFLSKYHKIFNLAMGLLLIYSAYSISGLSKLFQ